MSNGSWFQSPTKSSSLSLDIQGVPEKSTLENQNGQPGLSCLKTLQDLMTVNSRPGYEVRWVLVRFPNPLAYGSGLLHVRRGPCLGLGGSSWLIPLRRSTRPPPQVLWARGPCPRNTDSYTKQEKQGERKELTTKNKTEPTLSQQRYLLYEHRRIFLCLVSALCSKISAGQSASKFWCPSKKLFVVSSRTSIRNLIFYLFLNVFMCP